MKEFLFKQNLPLNAAVKKKAKQLAYHFFGPFVWTMLALLAAIGLLFLAGAKWQTSMPFYAQIAANLFVALLTVFVILFALSVAFFCCLRVYLQWELLNQVKSTLAEVGRFFLRWQENRKQKEREERLMGQFLTDQATMIEKLGQMAVQTNDTANADQLQQLVAETKRMIKEYQPQPSVMGRLGNIACFIGEGAALLMSIKGAYAGLKEAGLITESMEAKLTKALEDLFQKWQDAELGEKTDEKWQQLMDFSKEQLKTWEDFLDRQLQKFHHTPVA